jgi:tetratricopeptide (TPR) repeat protein
LRDAGILEIADGQCRVAPGVDWRAVALPDTVQGVITSRIDRLPAPQQLTLKVASVIGRVFALRVLSEIYPLESDKPHLGDHLDALRRLDLTPLDAPEPELAYIFKHIITQEVAYNLMLFAQRRDLHRLIAEWHERAYANELAAYYPLLAHHWGQAENPGKALAYLEKAGDDALRAGAYGEAAEFFREGLRLMEERDGAPAVSQRPSAAALRVGHWKRQLAEAYYGLGRMPAAQQTFAEALTLLGWPPPASRGQWAWALLRELARQGLNRRRPRHQLTAPAEQQPRIREAMRAWERYGRILFMSGDTLGMVYSGVLGTNLTEASTDVDSELARNYINLSIVAAAVPLPALAETYFRLATEAAPHLTDLPVRGWVLTLMGLYTFGVGRWAVAEDFFRQGSVIHERLGDYRRWVESWGMLATALHFRGAFVEAMRGREDCLRVARRQRDSHFEAVSLMGIVGNQLRLSLNSADTLALLTQAAGLFTETSARTDRFRLRGMFALIYLRQAQPQRAFESAAEALNLILAASPTAVYTLPGYSDTAEAFLHLWETNAAVAPPAVLRQAANRACRALARYARVFPVGRPRAAIWQGLHEWLKGQPTRARRAWQTALTLAQTLGMPYEEGLAHFQLGRHTTGPDRQSHLTTALEIFTRLGAAYDAAAAQTKLRRA